VIGGLIENIGGKDGSITTALLHAELSVGEGGVHWDRSALGQVRLALNLKLFFKVFPVQSAVS